jgi:hypothetical protein
MHQLHEEINKFKNFELRAKNPPNLNGFDSSQNGATKWSYTLKCMILVHNQASKMQSVQEKSRLKLKTLSCENLGKTLKNHIPQV